MTLGKLMDAGTNTEISSDESWSSLISPRQLRRRAPSCNCQGMNLKIDEIKETFQQQVSVLQGQLKTALEALAEQKVILCKLLRQQTEGLSPNSKFPLATEKNMVELDNEITPENRNLYVNVMKSLLQPAGVAKNLQNIISLDIIKEYNIDGDHGKKSFKRLSNFYNALLESISEKEDSITAEEKLGKLLMEANQTTKVLVRISPTAPLTNVEVSSNESSCTPRSTTSSNNITTETTNKELMTDTPSHISSFVKPSPLINYKEGQWSPENTTGKKRYDREQLLQLREVIVSRIKPVIKMTTLRQLMEAEENTKVVDPKIPTASLRNDGIDFDDYQSISEKGDSITAEETLRKLSMEAKQKTPAFTNVELSSNESSCTPRTITSSNNITTETTNKKLVTDTPSHISSFIKPSSLINYKEGQWSPQNTTGEKRYDREQLLQLREAIASRIKPVIKITTLRQLTDAKKNTKVVVPPSPSTQLTYEKLVTDTPLHVSSFIEPSSLINCKEGQWSPQNITVEEQSDREQSLQLSEVKELRIKPETTKATIQQLIDAEQKTKVVGPTSLTASSTNGGKNSNESYKASLLTSQFHERVTSCNSEGLNLKIDEIKDQLKITVEALAEQKVILRKLLRQQTEDLCPNLKFPLTTEEKMIELNDEITPENRNLYVKAMRWLLQPAHVAKNLTNIISTEIVIAYNIDGDHGKKSLRRLTNFYYALLESISVKYDLRTAEDQLRKLIHKLQGIPSTNATTTLTTNKKLETATPLPTSSIGASTSINNKEGQRSTQNTTGEILGKARKKTRKRKKKHGNNNAPDTA